jgi:putative NADPH-quinone reductase
MKKVLVVNGSPRGRGSASLRLAEVFLEGYRKGTEAELETIDLVDKDIRPCLGCYHCWKSGSGNCIQKDDMEAILQRYAQADLVLFNTPVYHFGMTALLKAFFERSLPLAYPYMVKKGELFAHPDRLQVNPRQVVGLFATCGFPDADNFRVLSAHVEKLFGSKLGFRFFCPEGELFKVPEMREAAGPRLVALREAGEAFARTGLVPAGAEAALASPMVDPPAFVRLANASWAVPGEEPPTEAALAGLEPYAPAGPSVAATPPKGGHERPSEAFLFLRRMSALYDAEAGAGLRAVVQFDFIDTDEIFQLAIAEGKCSLERGSPAMPTTRIIVPFATWEDISSGKIDGVEALMGGAYRVEGDFGLMSRFGSLFGPSRPAERRRPNLMALAFLPWYCGWFLGWNFWLGQALPLVLGLGFLVWRESRKEATWFERGTALAFVFLAALALAAPATFHAMQSFFCNTSIALVWAVSLLYGRPLTSEYSRLSMSGKIAASGIFRKINAQLTALWAILFGLCAAAGLCFAGAGQGNISIVTGIVLIPAGFFTAWYPKWYPGHLARRATPRVQKIH